MFEKEDKYEKMHFLIEQFFNHEVFTWQFYNASLFLVILAAFMFYKALVQYFFDWDKIEGNNNDS